MAACEQVLLAYVAAWNGTEEGKRRTLLETSWAENGIYTNPRKSRGISVLFAYL